MNWLGCLAAFVASGSILFAAAPPRLNDSVEGQKLARELRTVAPTETAQLTGLLRLSSPGRPPRSIPLKTSAVVTSTNWSAIYETGPTNAPSEVLVIRHYRDRPNEYEWRRGDKTVQPDVNSLTNAVAGSDFALLDLGLEFFHWPTQILVMREMRKGRGADVLESRPAQTNLYSRVLSWIDQQSRADGQPGLLMAEAYDARGRLLKEFEVKKVSRDGQLREVEIRNVQAKTSTRLQFGSGEE